ncbi:MAG: ATP-dependent DNA helicase [Ignavibacteria bacterium]|nr:ATP-dependent DNA helicase [Ignavibacteria bacterium]
MSQKIDKAKDTLRIYSSVFFPALEEKTYLKEENHDAMNMIGVLKEIKNITGRAIDMNDNEYIKKELTKVLEQCADIADKIETWAMQTQENNVYWATDKEICYCPIDIANILQQFWATKNTVITSATLTVNKSYKALRQALGLQEQCWGLRLDSPFNYRENAVVYCPSNAPLPNTEEYTAYLCQTIKNVVKKVSGKVFILFTSYAVMRACHAELATDKKHTWLLQGSSSKELLLQEYRQHGNSILLGTDTFWEGVDEIINCVIITKLPFEVPTTPIKKAQYDLVKSHGRSPFMDISLPRCALKLKQGAGRLIRNASHRGAVVICDPRIKKPWGNIIKNTLPDMCWTEDLNAIDAYINKAV